MLSSSFKGFCEVIGKGQGIIRTIFKIVSKGILIVKEGFRAIKETFRQLIQEHQIPEMVDSVKEETVNILGELFEDIKKFFSKSVETITTTVRTTLSSVKDYVRTNPVTSAGLVAGSGLVISVVPTILTTLKWAAMIGTVSMCLPIGFQALSLFI